MLSTKHLIQLIWQQCKRLELDLGDWEWRRLRDVVVSAAWDITKEQQKRTKWSATAFVDGYGRVRFEPIESAWMDNDDVDLTSEFFHPDAVPNKEGTIAGLAGKGVRVTIELVKEENQ
jgi:hypothetical protein